MEAGRLNRRITVQRKAVTYDAYNEPIESWADKYTVWAEVITSGGGEFYAAQKLNAQTTAVFKIRYTKAFTTLDRIKYESRIFEILSLNNIDGDRVELHISAKEVV